MTDMDLERQKFFSEGSKSYLNALIAIDAYQNIVEREIRDVLTEETLNNLSKVLGLDNRITVLNQYKAHDLNDGWCRWGISFDIPDCGRCYVFAEHTENGLFAEIIFETWSATWRDRIMKEVMKEPDFSKIFKHDWGNEIYVQQKVDTGNIQEFRDRIVDTVKLWIKFWKKVGVLRIFKDVQ